MNIKKVNKNYNFMRDAPIVGPLVRSLASALVYFLIHLFLYLFKHFHIYFLTVFSLHTVGDTIPLSFFSLQRSTSNKHYSSCYR